MKLLRETIRRIIKEELEGHEEANLKSLVATGDVGSISQAIELADMLEIDLRHMILSDDNLKRAIYPAVEEQVDIDDVIDKGIQSMMVRIQDTVGNGYGDYGAEAFDDIAEKIKPIILDYAVEEYLQQNKKWNH